MIYRTCYYVLGLIAKTQQGVELLGELNWEGVVCSNGFPEGLCVPTNFRQFLTVSIIYYSFQSTRIHLNIHIDSQLGIYTNVIRPSIIT